ncbi:hypothetical protein GCM10027051_16280 [Niabella terrae]
MINFLERDNKLLFFYQPEDKEYNWISERLKVDGSVHVKRTFFFTKKDVIEEDIDEEFVEDALSDIEPEGIYLWFGDLENDYYKVKRGILTSAFDIYLHKDIELKLGYFVADANASIFNAISKISKLDFYLGGPHQTAVPIEDFEKLTKYFPTSYERKRYVEARIATVLRNYLDNVKDAEQVYERYMNKKLSKEGSDLSKIFKDNELYKYQTIYRKLEGMLMEETQYNERQWQREILQIILLIYPKYIYVFKEVKIKAGIAGDVRERFLDLLLVDCNGNVDIIEIKRPFEKAIMTNDHYRNNFIPLRELSGAVMQVEKYVYYLNRWSEAGEEYLNNTYKNELPEGFDIKITNPGGIIIMGRENNLTSEQKRDFEVVKRKYKNVVDIITYDNLLDRLKFTIDQIKKL